MKKIQVSNYENRTHKPLRYTNVYIVNICNGNFIRGMEIYSCNRDPLPCKYRLNASKIKYPGQYVEPAALLMIFYRWYAHSRDTNVPGQNSIHEWIRTKSVLDSREINSIEGLVNAYRVYVTPTRVFS